MAGEHRSLVEQIQAFLSVSNRPVDARIQEVGASFAQVCADTNRRLERCRTLLGQNLRSAAISVAESEPSLFELVPEISFDEFEQWESVAIESQGAESSLETPQRILNLIFEDLDNAYAAELKVRPLMKKHRRLVLMGAPLPERIKLMREVVKLDDERSWRDDLDEYETARLTQIEVEGRDAAKIADTKSLKQLQEELSSPDWIVSVPDTLKRKISRVSEKIREAQLVEQLEQMVPSVHAAVANEDQDELLRVRDDWLKIAANIRHSADRLQQLNEPLNAAWELAEKLSRQRAADDLQAEHHSALTLAIRQPGQHTLTELDNLYSQASAAGVEITPGLAAEFQAAVAAAQNLRRNRMLRVSGAAVVCLILLSGTGWFIWSQHVAAGELETLLGRAAVLIENDNHEGARKDLSYFLQQYSGFVENDDVVALDNRIARLESRENERAMAFTETVEAAEREITLGNDPEKFLTLLAESKRTETDRNMIQRLRTDFHVARKRALQKAEERALERFTKAETLLASAKSDLSALDVQSVAASISAATELLTDIPRLNELSDTVRKRHASNQTLLQSISAQAKTERDRLKSLATLNALAVSTISNWPNCSPASYEMCLQNYRSQDTQRWIEVGAHTDHWDPLIKWDFSVRRWSERGVFPKTAREASGRRTTLAALSLGKSAIRRQLSTLIDEIHGRELNGGFSSYRTRVTDVLKQSWFYGSTLLVGPADATGKFGAFARFTLPSTASVVNRSGRHQFKYLASLKRQESMQIRMSGWQPQRKATRASIVAEDCLSQINRVSKTFEYDRTMIEVIQRLINEKEMRPELRLVAIYQLLQAAGGGSSFLESHSSDLLESSYRNFRANAEIKPEHSTMKEWLSTWETGDWIAPNAKKPESWLEICLSNLNAELSTVLPAIRKDVEDISHEVMRVHAPIGYIWVDSEIRIPIVSERAQPVYVLDSQGDLRRIGEVVKGAVQRDTRTGKLTVGQLLFVEQTVEFDNSWVDGQLGLKSSAVNATD